MGNYQKTAKDKAWDRERQKLQTEIQRLKQEGVRKASIISTQEQEMLAMSVEIDELKRTIDLLTAGNMTPEEAVAEMRKQGELVDTMKFLAKGARGLFY
jgi:hypothetical protein